jgi:Transposase DDE domain group 1
MRTEGNPDLIGFARVAGREVVAAFDGGAITSDAGALLLGATDREIGMVERFGGCFRDSRAAEPIEHEVKTPVGQRVFALAPGYEDLNDHDELRHDPRVAVLAGKLAGRRKACAPLARFAAVARRRAGPSCGLPGQAPAIPGSRFNRRQRIKSVRI